MEDYEVELEKVSKPIFGISPRRYRQLADEGIVPPVVKGKIKFVAACKGLIAYYRKLAEASGSLSLTDERAALTAIKKEQEKLKLEIMKGNLVLREQAVIWLKNIITIAKNHFLVLPKRVSNVYAVKTEPKEIEEDLENEIWMILNEMAQSKIEYDRSKTLSTAKRNNSGLATA